MLKPYRECSAGRQGQPTLALGQAGRSCSRSWVRLGAALPSKAFSGLCAWATERRFAGPSGVPVRSLCPALSSALPPSLQLPTRAILSRGSRGRLRGHIAHRRARSTRVRSQRRGSQPATPPDGDQRVTKSLPPPAAQSRHSTHTACTLHQQIPEQGDGVRPVSE